MSDHKSASLSGRDGDEGQVEFKHGQCSVVPDTPPTQLRGSLVSLGFMAASLWVAVAPTGV